MAQFNSLTDKVRQMLGGMPQTLSDIGNRVGSNLQWAGKQAAANIPKAVGNYVNNIPQVQAGKILAQNVQALPKLMPQFQENARANPIPMKAFEGLVEGSTWGLKDINYRPSQNIGEKAAYLGGYGLGLLNPLSPVNRTAGLLKGTTAVKALQSPLGKIAGKAIAKGGAVGLLGRGVANLSQGLPYTGAYAIGKSVAQGGVTGESIPTDLGIDLAIGSIPVVGGLAIGSKGLRSKAGQFFDDRVINSAKKHLGNEARRTIGQFASLIETSPGANRKNLGAIGDEIQSIAEGIWGNKAKSLTNTQLKNAFDVLLYQLDKAKGYNRDLAFGLSTQDIRGTMKQGEKLTIKPGESLGAFQQRIEESSRPLLRQFNDLVSNKDYKRASEVLDQMKKQDVYKDYVKPLGNLIGEQPNPLDPLLSEAKKYKSAKEFVKNEGMTVYRASPSPFPTDKWVKGQYFAPTEQQARYYSESHLQPGQQPQDIQVTKVELPKSLLQKTNGGNSFILKEEFPVKSQLTDIWNQANKGNVTNNNYIPDKIYANRAYSNYKGSRFIKGKYNGRDYVSDGFIMEYDSNVKAPTKAEVVDNPMRTPSEDVIRKFYEGNFTQVEPQKVLKGDSLTYVRLGDSEYVNKKYFDYFLSKYKDAKFLVNSRIKNAPIMVKSGETDIGFLMPIRALDNIEAKNSLVWERKSSSPTSPSGRIQNSLIEEAKKYKSAEEFVRGQEEILYHGGTAKDLKSYNLNYEDRRTQNPLGVYLTNNRKVAEDFGSNILETKLPNNSKILDLSKAKTVGDIYDSLKQFGFAPPREWEGSTILAKDTIKYHGGAYQIVEDILSNNPDILKSIKGKYDGMKWSEMKGGNIFDTSVIFDPKKLETVSQKIPQSKSQLTDIWNQANKGVENPITKLESQLHPDDVKTLKVDKEIEGWSDKQYKSILEDKIQELNDFAGGQMSKDASYVDLQSSINELRKTAKEIGKPELAKMVELEADKISDPEQARKYIMNGLRGIRDQRFANKAKSAPKGFNPMEDLPGTRPGLRAEFDNAINRKDVAIIQKLLPEVPDTYKKQVGKYLDPILNTSQPKTVRTIKVAGQSRTQQPISSPASGNVGTVAGASGGQTSQPILETAPLNKSIPQRGFAESVQTNKKTPAEIKPELEKIRYEPISNAETMAQADKIIQTDELKALDFAKNNTDTTANSVSLKLIEKYLDQGRFSEANDLISAVAPRFTKAGQEIQILSTYGRLTPTGAIKYAQTLINQANKANPKLNLKLTEANTKIITEYANRVQSLPVGSRERIVATAQLMQKITDQVPPSIGQKIATIQTMMQLLNPKTAIRNIIGNTLFTGAENISDVFATGLDRITSIITGRRSKVLPSITAQGKGFIKGGKEGLEDAMLGIDTSGGVSSQFEIKGKTFTDPIFGSLEKALNIELRVPDRAAYTAAFEGSLNNQMRAAGVAKATSEMIEIAHADGLYRTFQDNSRLAQIFSGVKKTLNKIGTPDGKFGLGDFIIKYPKTPANILSRGLDYSPAGFVKGIYEGIRPFMTGQPFNQKQFVENLSRAMVGTGLISAGYILAKNGIISGKNDKDYDISSVKRTTGQGAFKLNVSALARFFQSGGQKQDDQNGDTLVSYDWAQPTSIQVAMGANSALGGNAEDMASIASDNLQAGVDTLTGQSMVKNLMDYAGGIKDKGFVGATQDMALNSATGFIPSVVRQTANVFDPLQRSTYAETPAGVAINKAKATIPFVRNTLEPKLDVFGKEMPNYEGSGLRRLFDIFVNPAFVTKIQENPAAKEVIDIYQRSGLTTQAPRVADSKIKINGQDVKVSPRQYTEYQRYIGTKTDETFNALMNDPLFRKSSDEEKAKLLQGILTDINSAAKIELFGNNPKSIPQDVKNIIKSSTNATDRMLTLTKEGNLKMAMGDIEYPKLTGNTELDKKLISSYQGKLTQKANEVVAMFEAGEITAAQAESELSKIIELKKKVSTKKAKKAPKITVRKLSAPKVAKSARIKIKIPKLKKPKTLKLKKYTVKLSK